MKKMTILICLVFVSIFGITSAYAYAPDTSPRASRLVYLGGDEFSDVYAVNLNKQQENDFGQRLRTTISNYANYITPFDDSVNWFSVSGVRGVSYSIHVRYFPVSGNPIVTTLNNVNNEYYFLFEMQSGVLSLSINGEQVISAHQSYNANDEFEIWLYYDFPPNTWNDGYRAGYVAGETSGYNSGYGVGFDNARSQYGIFTSGTWQNATWWGEQEYLRGFSTANPTNFGTLLSALFGGLGTLLAIEIIPQSGITFGVMLAVPLVFGTLALLLGGSVKKKGGKE